MSEFEQIRNNWKNGTITRDEYVVAVNTLRTLGKLTDEEKEIFENEGLLNTDEWPHDWKLEVKELETYLDDGGMPSPQEFYRRIEEWRQRGDVPDETLTGLEQKYLEYYENYKKSYELQYPSQKPLTAEQARERWLDRYNVPQSELDTWQNRPIYIDENISPERPGQYDKWKRRVESAPETSAKVIGHEMAHANYYENMPLEMHLAYPWLNALAQMIDPSYRKASTYGESQNLGVGSIDKGRLPPEGYAVSYGSQNTPWYLEPFYGNLKYPVPDLPGPLERNPLVWLAAWLKYKLADQPLSPFFSKKTSIPLRQTPVTGSSTAIQQIPQGTLRLME